MTQYRSKAARAFIKAAPFFLECCGYDHLPEPWCEIHMEVCGGSMLQYVNRAELRCLLACLLAAMAETGDLEGWLS